MFWRTAEQPQQQQQHKPPPLSPPPSSNSATTKNTPKSMRPPRRRPMVVQKSPETPPSRLGQSFSNRRRRKSFFWRKKNLVSDVASVGNASDTMVPLDTQTSRTGRELHEKAKLHFHDGEYQRALPLFEAILSAQVRRFSPLHPSVGAALHNVGVCRCSLGQYDLALPLLQEAVQIRRDTTNQPEQVATSLSKLGLTRLALGQRDAAHDDLCRALELARSFDSNSSQVAQILGHLGGFYFQVDELYASLASFTQALAIYRELWPRETDRDACMAQLTNTLCNIGTIQNRRQQYMDAIASFQEALDLQRGILGHDDPRVIATLDNLGYSYSKHKDYAKALQCYRKLLRVQISHQGTFHADCLESFRKQLYMYEKLDKIEEAVAETKEIVQLQKSLLRNQNDPVIRKTLQLQKKFQQKLQSL